ncbi:phosphate ABC transporter permease PstA [Halorhabdus rudnickae]|uniref:phosphate ABC transporter permease PstA n=1 Tax=Halorhabdus rudnickae TaxID=1775544 RepID=UPI0010837C3F|nr:phosphate ABC transporter permease PstA [Halorhabdus rudnickae]
MSNVERTTLVAGERTISGSLGASLIAIAFLAFVSSWATILQWLEETGTYLGVALFDLLGGFLLVIALGLAIAGLASRFGYLTSTPSRSAGVPVAVVFGLMWAVVGGLAGTAYVGGAVWMIGALVGAILGAGTALFLREDVGSTLPAATLVGLMGYVVLAGEITVGWTWEPTWLSAEFPGSEIVPVLVIFASLLAFWSGAKAKEGFGAQGRQAGVFYLIGMSILSMLGVLALLILFITWNGLDVMLTGASLLGGELVVPLLGVGLPFPELPFVTNVTGGLFVEIPGVLPAAMGTLWLVFGAMLFAVPLGVGAAIFLTEYAEQGRMTQIVEVATNGLWSTPSIVFGLFGMTFLVPRISGGNSIIVGQLVLGFMLLPLVLITSRESILAVPDEYRDASAALGVTRWETIKSVVVPASMPGVITGVIIGVGRIAGETAPLLLVFGGSPFPDSTPNVLGSFEFSLSPPFVTNQALLEPASALPYQLYSSITAGVFPKEIFTDTEFGWGTALVLLLIVIGLYAIGIGSRLYFRRKLNYE